MKYDPCTVVEALQRANDLLVHPETKIAGYALGGGNYRPGQPTPYTLHEEGTNGHRTVLGADCRIAVLHCWKLPGHEPGINHGSWATVSDDLDYNALIEDAQHAQTLGTVVTMPKAGDILAYKTQWIKTEHGTLKFIGHGSIILAVPDDYKPGEGYHRLTLAQCHGPTGFSPAFVKTDGSVFDHHDHEWPKSVCVIVRMKERA